MLYIHIQDKDTITQAAGRAVTLLTVDVIYWWKIWCSYLHRVLNFSSESFTKTEGTIDSPLYLEAAGSYDPR